MKRRGTVRRVRVPCTKHMGSTQSTHLACGHVSRTLWRQFCEPSPLSFVLFPSKSIKPAKTSQTSADHEQGAWTAAGGMLFIGVRMCTLYCPIGSFARNMALPLIHTKIILIFKKSNSPNWSPYSKRSYDYFLKIIKIPSFKILTMNSGVPSQCFSSVWNLL